MPGQRARVITPEMMKNMKDGPGITPHSHSFIELFYYFGINMDDASDLGGEIEFWLTKSFMVYIPAGLKHCPLRLHRMDAPMFQLTVGSGTKYE